MDFEFLDRYLLDGSPAKHDVVKRLLVERSQSPQAGPFYEGMRMLGARTPDLSLIALRLVLAGKKADDANVVELRKLIDEAKAGDAEARKRYRMLVGGTETV